MNRPLQHPFARSSWNKPIHSGLTITDDPELFPVWVAKSVFFQFYHSSILISLAFFCKESFSLSNLLIMYSCNSFEYSWFCLYVQDASSKVWLI